ncbi:MAG TPA: GAF domain-containing sensor histidine kinase, partial [Ramlibacter sp.]|nr:GAF domain-containing sensor histidine kinase [Ramlibacter sp.]
MATLPVQAGIAPQTTEEVRARLEALSSPREMLEEIVLRAPVGLQLCDRAGRTVIVNPVHTQMFGAVPPPDYNIFEDSLLAAQGVTDLVRRAFNGERITIAPIWYDARQLSNVKVPHARRLAVGAELVPLRAGGAEVSHVLFVFHDVTDLHLAREQAEQAAHRSAFLAEASQAFSASLDFDSTLRQVALMATPRFADFCIVDVVEAGDTLRRVVACHADPGLQPVLDELSAAYAPDSTSPQPAMRVFRSGQPELLEQVDDTVIAQHTRDARHAQLMRRLGVRSHLAVPMKLRDRIVGVINLGYSEGRRYTPEDVALMEAVAGRAAAAIEHARLFTQVQQAMQAAEVANRAKDEFLAVLGHELRNPMAPIANAVELIRLRDGESREVEILQRQVRHMRRLIDDLLDVSRITRGKLVLDLAPMDLRDAVRQSLELVQPLVAERRLELRIDMPVGEPLPVKADRGRLVQAVTNLLTNAVRFTEAGGQVQVRAWHEDGAALVAVTDTGVGIAANLIERIFEPFVQAEQGMSRNHGGLGLGLAIVRSIVQAHGGSVQAVSAGPG